MLVNGVDISMLEGWMIKINSKPSFFGKTTSRRWFKVGFVSGSNSERKLVISYSTSKKAKDPRGLLYVQDVSDVYCRKEMIEIVSPSRTLRLRGETSVEHRLWADSLYKLCNAQPKLAKASIDTQHKTKEGDREKDDQSVYYQRSDSIADEKRRSRRLSRHDSDREEEDLNYRNGTESREISPRDGYGYEARQRDARSSQHYESKSDELESRSSPQSSHDESDKELVENKDSASHFENDGSESDSSEDNHDSSRPSTNSSSRSLLVAQIKAGPTFEAGLASCKNVMSDSEEEDEKISEEKESPREPVTSSTSPIDDDDDVVFDKVEPLTQSPKHKNSPYFKESAYKATLVSSVAADNNFVYDDWDAEGEDRRDGLLKSGTSDLGVAPDANFVHEDWDE